jgi:serine protease Do
VQGTVGGDIITAIDGQTINSMSDIIAYLAIHTQVGQTVTLTIMRNGQTQTVQVTLGSRPSQ